MNTPGPPQGGPLKNSALRKPGGPKRPIFKTVKKLAAILLIAILFFNWYGYRLLTNYWQQQATRRLEARFNHNDYEPFSLIAIKFPIKSLSCYNPDTTNIGNSGDPGIEARPRRHHCPRSRSKNIDPIHIGRKRL